MSSPPAQPACAVVFCQHGLADPLVGTLVLDYIIRLRAAGDLGPCLLFTEEPPRAQHPKGTQDRLEEAGIHWVPLRYDVRGRQWMQRLRNVRCMLQEARRFTQGKGRCWMIGFLSYGGTYALLAQWFGLGPAMVVCFEPHSRYMVELGLWGRSSPKTPVAGWLERMQMRHSRAMLVPTDAVRELVASNRPKGHVMQQAITIDVKSARFDPQARTLRRAELGFGDDLVLVYVGKFGGIYLSVDAYLRFLAGLFEASKVLRAYIISFPDEIERIRSHPAYTRHADRITLHGPVSPGELVGHLSASDIGVVAIPPSPAQAFRTPVKTAHYWAAGLPILIAQGVSDDHRIAAEEGVGVVVKDFGTQSATESARRLEMLGQRDRGSLRAACMTAAERYRDTALMVDRLRSLLQCT